jgi:hypothetical protein
MEVRLYPGPGELDDAVGLAEDLGGRTEIDDAGRIVVIVDDPEGLELLREAIVLNPWLGSLLGPASGPKL